MDERSYKKPMAVQTCLSPALQANRIVADRGLWCCVVLTVDDCLLCKAAMGYMPQAAGGGWGTVRMEVTSKSLAT